MHLRRISSAALIALFLTSATGCMDSMLSESGSQKDSDRVASTAAPTDGKLRHPQLANLPASEVAGKGAAAEAHVFVAFNQYEADGVTRRVLDSYGVTRRVLEEYGVTRRVLDSYRVTRRILEEYGVTRRVLDAYGVTRRVLDSYGITAEVLDQANNEVSQELLSQYGITMEMLEGQGVTRRVLDDYGVTRRVLDDYGISDGDYASALESFERNLRLKVRIDNAVPGLFLSLGSLDLATFLDEVATDTDISFVELDIPVQGPVIASLNDGPHSSELLPWGVERSGAPAESAANVEVYVLDSGVQTYDLNVVERKDFTSLFLNRNQTTWDDSAIQEQPYFDPGDSGNPNDESGHGTHIAGTIGAFENNSGVVGIAPGVEIHSLKVLTANGRTDITTLTAALDYVLVQKHLRPTKPMVVNLSLGMDIETTAYNVLDEAVKQVIDAGITVVVSAGNNGMDASTVSPAHVADAITVGAYDIENDMTAFSNYGTAVDIFAPGDLIVSLSHDATDVAGGFAVVESGTSMAAPHVAGAAAVFLASNPQASPQQVRNSLVQHARKNITNAPTGTTNDALWIGSDADGAGILDETLPPFFQYAILTKGSLELQAGVGIWNDVDPALNANVLSNDSLLYSDGVDVRGFGYTAVGASDKQLGNRYFQPVLNPAGLDGVLFSSQVEIPRLDVHAFSGLAHVKNFDPLGLQLSGNYDCGTREEPKIWYVQNDLETDGKVTLNGYCIFLVGGNIQIQHTVQVVNDAPDASLALYAGGELQIEKNGLNLAAQIFVGDVQVQGSNVIFRGSLTVNGSLEFEGNIDVAYQPANCVLTEPFWPTGNCDTAPAPTPEPTPEPAPTDQPAPGTPFSTQDDFETADFAGSTGSQDWTSAWTEHGESNGTTRGKVRIVSSSNCSESKCVKVAAGKVRGVWRTMDLSGASFATLSFDYKTVSLDGAAMQLQASSDGGATWTKVTSFTANMRSSMSVDLTGFISDRTAIRFISSSDGGGSLFVDNVRVENDSAGNGGGY